MDQPNEMNRSLAALDRVSRYNDSPGSTNTPRSPHPSDARSFQGYYRESQDVPTRHEEMPSVDGQLGGERVVNMGGTSIYCNYAPLPPAKPP